MQTPALRGLLYAQPRVAKHSEGRYRNQHQYRVDKPHPQPGRHFRRAHHRQWTELAFGAPFRCSLQPNETINLAANISGLGLADGANKGSLNVQVTSGSSGSLVIPVTVKKGIGSELSATPNPLNLATSRGSTTPVEDVISIESSSGAISLSTKVFSSVNQPWLAVKPFSSTVSPGSPVILW